jgi:hypothetical protein
MVNAALGSSAMAPTLSPIVCVRRMPAATQGVMSQRGRCKPNSCSPSADTATIRSVAVGTDSGGTCGFANGDIRISYVGVLN